MSYTLKTNTHKILLLFLFPVILFFFYLKLNNNLSSFNQRSYDPEYLYLISGMTLGSGKLNVGHIDNPGTPVQIIWAVSTRIQQLFIGEKDYVTDIFSNPAVYMQVTSYVFTGIIILILVLSGLVFFSLTKNIACALFIQTAPFLYNHIMVDFTRIMPDVLMIIPVFIFISYSIYFVQNKNTSSVSDILGFSIISGLGLAFKLNFIAFWIIPIIVLHKWKDKLIFLSGAIIAFFILAFPILFKLDFIWKWIKNLLLHSGQYGGGNANIVEWDLFFQNFKLIFSNYWILYLVCFFGILSSVILYFRDKSYLKNQYYRLLLGFIVCVLIHTFLVSKHFAFRYMYNILFTTTFILFLIFELLSKEFRLKKSYLLYIIGIVLSGYFIVEYNNYSTGMIGWTKDVADKKSEELRIIREKVGDAPFVIIPNNYDLMFEERGIIFGCAFAGGHKKLFQEKLIKMKPNFYLSEPTANKFWHWMEQMPLAELKEKYNEFYLFVGKDHINNKELFLEKIGCDYQLEELYNFEASGDQLLSVKLFEF